MKKKLWTVLLVFMMCVVVLPTMAFAIANAQSEPSVMSEAPAVDGNWIDEADTSWYNTENTEFTIDTAADLAGLASIVNGTATGIEQDSFTNKTITLGEDIDLASKEWTPIGDYACTKQFGGTFDGNGKTISGVTISQSFGDTTARVGLFSGLQGAANASDTNSATVKNIILTEVNISVSGSDVYAGGLVGYLNRGTYIKNNVKVEKSAITTTVQTNSENKAGTVYVGGLCGRAYCDIVSEANISEITVTHSGDGKAYIGGVVGHATGHESYWTAEEQNTSFTNCEAKSVSISSNASGTVYAGGFLGACASYNGSKNSYYSCDVSILNLTLSGGATYYAGGFMGFQSGMGTDENCTASGTISSTGTNTTSVFGGFVGYQGGRPRTHKSHEVSVDIAVSYGNVGGFVGGMQQYKSNLYSFETCTANGNVSTQNGVAGGFIGILKDYDGGYDIKVTLDNCTAYGKVSGSACAGGLWGYINVHKNSTTTEGIVIHKNCVPATDIQGTVTNSVVNLSAKYCINADSDTYVVGASACYATVEGLEIGYPSIQSAIDAGVDNVTLLADVTEGFSMPTACDGGFTLHTNGKGFIGGTADTPMTVRLRGEVTLTGDINIKSGYVVIQGENATLKRDSSLTKRMIVIPSGANLTIDGVTLDGGAVWEGEEDATLNRSKNNNGIKATDGIIKYIGSLTIKNSIIQNSASSSGNAAIFTDNNATFAEGDGNLTVENCKFLNNYSTGNGGAIYPYAGRTPSITSTAFTGNHSANGGAIYCGGSVSLTDCAFSNNLASESGGAIYTNGALSMTNVDFTENSAGTYGGAIRGATGFDISYNGGSMTGNSAGGSGGAVYVYSSNANSTLSILGGTIKDNTAPKGQDIYFATANGNYTLGGGVEVGGFELVGGTETAPMQITIDGEVGIMGTIAISSGYVIINGTDASEDMIKRSGFNGNLININTGANIAIRNLTIDGGAIWTGDTNATLNRGTVNTGFSGGNMFKNDNGYVSLNNCTLQNHDGSQIFNCDATNYKDTLAVDNCKIINSNGGVIWTRSYATFNNTEIAFISGNPSVFRPCTSSKLTISNCDIHHNYGTSEDGVGVIAKWSSCTVDVHSTKFHNNFAPKGAVMDCTVDAPHFYNCEFTNNTASVTGGVFNLRNANGVRLHGNTVISGNSASKGSAVYTEKWFVLEADTIALIENNTGSAAIYMANGSNTVVQILGQCTFSGNTAGDLYVEAYQSVELNQHINALSIVTADGVALKISGTPADKILHKINYNPSAEEGVTILPYITEANNEIRYVKCHLNGGEGETVNNVKKHGYNLVWCADSELTTDLDGEPQAGGEYYAKWIYEVRYDLNGFDETIESQTQLEKMAATLATPKARTGYTFSGWNTQADGTGTPYEANSERTFDGHTTLYAIWAPITYTICFDSNTPPTSTVKKISATYDKYLTLENPVFTNEGYTFVGWADKANADDTDMIYATGTKVVNLHYIQGEVVTLYAIWKEQGKRVHSPDLTPQEANYDGKEKNFAVKNEHGDEENCFTVTYLLNGETVEKPTNAGVYDVKLDCGETATYAAYHNTIMGGLVIKPQQLESITWADVSFTYDGTDFSASVTATYTNINNQTVSLKVALGEGIEFINAGKYTFTASFADSDTDSINYLLPSDVTREYAIAKAQIQKPQADTTTFTYTGSAQIYTVAISDYYTASGHIQTNAGSYQVTISLDDTANYEWTDGTTENLVYAFRIAQKDITGAEITLGTTLTYNGSEQAQTVESVTVDGLTVTYTVSGDTATNVDEHGYTLTVTGNGNFTGTATATWNLSKDTNVWTSELTISDWVYGSPSVPSVTAKHGEVEYAWFDSNNVLLSEKPVNAGNYFVQASVAQDGYNYDQIVSDYVAFTIEQKEIGLQWSAPIDLVYSGTAKVPTVVATGLVGQDVVNVTIGLTTENDNVNVGTFTYTASGLDNSNYKLPANVTSESYTITQKEIVIDWCENNYTYNGAIQIVTATYNDVNGNPVALTVATTGEFKNYKEGGYTFTASFANGETNYKLPDDVTAVYNIKKATYDMSDITFADDEFTYDGQEHSLVINGTLPTGEDGVQVTVSYSGSATNVADGEVTVTATFATTSANYNIPDVMTAKVKINAKSISGATITLGDSLTYTGSQQTQTITSVVVDGLTVTYDVSGNVQTNVGENDYTLTVTGNGNFTDEATKTWNITRKTVNASVEVVGQQVYTGSEICPNVIVKDGDVEIPSTEYTVGYSGNVNAGTATVTVSNANGGNYDVTGSATFEIGKANPTFDLPTNLTGVGGSKLESIQLPDGFAWSNANEVIECGNGQYEITYTPADTANYNVMTNTIVVNGAHTYGDLIAKVDATCSTTGFEAHYFCDVCDTYFTAEKVETTDVALTIAIDENAHNYGEPTYVWAEDNSTCAATRVCSHNGAHKDTETVNATSVVTQEQSCTDDELTTYTATFTNPAFETQIKENVKTKDSDFVFDVGNTLPDGAEIIVNKINADSEEGKAILDELADYEYNPEKGVAIFDIYAEVDGEKVQPNGKISVTVHKPMSDVNNYVIYHMKDDGSIETLYATAQDGKLSFEISSFSNFVFAEKEVTSTSFIDNSVLKTIIAVVSVLAVAYVLYYLFFKERN